MAVVRRRLSREGAAAASAEDEAPRSADAPPAACRQCARLSDKQPTITSQNIYFDTTYDDTTDTGNQILMAFFHFRTSDIKIDNVFTRSSTQLDINRIGEFHQNVFND